MSILTSVHPEIYECTLQELSTGIPTTLFPRNHPFRTFLQNHLRSLSTTRKYDGVIDAFVSVYSGNALWRSKSSSSKIVTWRQRIRNLISERPPNFILVSQNISDGYGFHDRTHAMQNFICITKHYVDAWDGAAADTYLELALEAVLKATINHELGHWLFTLRVGPFQQSYLYAMRFQMPQRQVKLGKLSEECVQENETKHAPKSIRAVWEGDSGEAGNFVEVQSQGGIIGFDNVLNIATIQTEANTVYNLNLPYLQALRQESSVRFTPPIQGSPQRPKGAHSHLSATPRTPVFFPERDGCIHPNMQDSPPPVSRGLSVTSRHSCIMRMTNFRAAE